GARALARGPLSAALIETMQRDDAASVAETELLGVAESALAVADSISEDDDIQLALFLLYACAYGSLSWIEADWEWNPALLRVRRLIEDEFERELRRDVVITELPPADAELIAAELFRLTAPEPGPSLARFVAKHATLAQAEE